MNMSPHDDSRSAEDPRLDRLRRLLSRSLDDEATPAQQQELDDAQEATEPLVESAVAYLTVRDHVLGAGGEQADRLLDALRRARLETRALHRMLVGAAAAALVVAVGLSSASALRDSGGEPPTSAEAESTNPARARGATRLALLRTSPFSGASETR